MAYIGNDLQVAFSTYKNIDDISGSFNGVTTSFALLVNGVAPAPLPLNSNQCLISVGGVVQRPDDTGAEGFRLSGGNIVFSSAPNTAEDFFGVILAGADYVNAGANFPDGTLAAPSITFDQDNDTGYYRSGSGSVSFASNGVAAGTWSSAGLTAPAFIPTGSSVPANGVYLPSANTLGVSTNGSARLTVDSSGRLLVGTSSGYAISGLSGPDVQLSKADQDSTLAVTAWKADNNDFNPTLQLMRSYNNTTGTHTAVPNGARLGAITFAGSNGTAFSSGAQITANADGQTWASGDCPGRLVFSTTADGASSPTERMRITSAGNVSIGTAASGARLELVAGNQVGVTVSNTNTSDLIAVKGNAGGSSGSSVFVMPMRFGDDTLRGSIFWNGSTVAYNTTSDYRLKENVNSYTGALGKLTALKPVTYNFIDNPGVVLEGFIAHEVQDVVPNAASGTKDEVDDDGNPVYQGIDQSKLVPLLTAALQEAIGEIESLKARVVALESA